MKNIKKQYEQLHSFLLENKNKKVSSIIEELEEMMSVKTQSTIRRDDEGNVTHIFCYYHKEWESLDEVEYGTKSSSSSGYNTMCKEGVNMWTKQQRVSKKRKEELLDKVSKGEIPSSDLPHELEKIEEERNMIVPRGESTPKVEDETPIKEEQEIINS